MTWTAANITKRSGSSGQGNRSKSHISTKNAPQRSSETVEAALSRLTKAYSSAMNCIGSLHQLAQVQENQEKEVHQRVFRAARTTLEEVLLSDPLIVPFAPTWNETHSAQSQVIVTGPLPPVLTSAAHRSTVRDLAYLSLINYADLMTKNYVFPDDQGKRTDATEAKTVSQRLALVALVDASNVDGSDPTVWIKLASAARSLDAEKYSRLIRHALERGQLCLGPNVPPNRTLVRQLAMFEQRQQSTPTSYPPKIQETPSSPPIHLELPRHSWSTLGRLLLRACREGSAFQVHHHNNNVRSNNSNSINNKHLRLSDAFGSPHMVLQLSPLLAVPSTSLGNICTYLEQDQVWKFEATCRALMASILSARASLEQAAANSSSHGNSTQPKAQDVTEKSDTPNDSNPSGQPAEPTSAAASNELLPPAQATTHDNQNSVSAETTNTEQHPPARSQLQSSRSSKRVLSKLITSGKLAERKLKQSSVEFCLVAAVLGCDVSQQEYKTLVRTAPDQIPWNDLIPGLLPWGVSSKPDENHGAKSQHRQQQRSTLGRNVQEQEMQGRLGDASLTAFLHRTSGHNAGPLDVLEQFLIHAAWNVEQVFGGDPEGTNFMAANIIDCVQVLATRSGVSRNIEPTWYYRCQELLEENRQACLESYSVNLLYAELRLRRCERQPREDCGYDSDRTALSTLVPNLLGRMEEINQAYPDCKMEKKWMTLQTRSHWLASGFYIWWCQTSGIATESRKAESLALEHIEDALRCLRLPLEDPISSVRTPQLESLGRTDAHWKLLSESTLKQFGDEIQASTVVTVARDRFVERLGCIQDADGLSQDDKDEFSQIGSDLMRRYDLKYEGPTGRHEELLNEFLVTCGDELHADLNEVNGADPSLLQRKWKRLWSIIPSQSLQTSAIESRTNPSILSILITCLQAGTGHHISILTVLTKVSLCAYEQQSSLLKKIANSDSGTSGLADDDSSSDSDDSFSSDDDMSLSGDTGGVTESRLRLVGGVIQFLTEKIADIFCSILSEDEQAQFVSSEECLSLIHFSFSFSVEWGEHAAVRPSTVNASLDLDIFISTHFLLKSLLDSVILEEAKQKITSLAFVGLVGSIISQVQSFRSILRPRGNNRLGRSARQKLCIRRARYIGALTAETACMLSKSLAPCNNDTLQPSFLIEAFRVTSDEKKSTISCRLAGLALFVESLLSLWDYVTGKESRRSLVSSTSAFDRPVVEELAVPVAAVITGLCGSAVMTRLRPIPRTQATSTESDPICLIEFYETDASANSWFDDAEKANEKRRELLRAICHAAHCISLVYNGSSDKSITSFKSTTSCDRHHGSLLPLVTTRVLNHFVDILLVRYDKTTGSESDLPGGIWAKEWPTGTRTVGSLIDTTLHRAYRGLHGFSLDPSNSGGSTDDSSQGDFSPESVVAAIRLYRCIMRAYGGGRKTAPKAALECVTSALPAVEEGDRTRALRGFLFGTTSDYFSIEEVTSLFTGEDKTVENLPPDWVWKSRTSENEEKSSHSDTNDILLVRKGICHELAQGPLPSFSSGSSDNPKSSKGDERKGKADERLDALRVEVELGKKFTAVLDDICFGELINSQGWFTAAQCLSMKSEVVANRLGLSNGFCRLNDFHIPTGRSPLHVLSRLPNLLHSQEAEDERNKEGWTPFIGNDLSVYIRHAWSSFSSLEECAREVGTDYRDIITGRSRPQDLDENHEQFRAQVWREIGLLYEKENFSGWQQAWGGIFVSALRVLATRCRYIALSLVLRKPSDEASAVISEMAESQAISFYSELMGSQTYGYPMRSMSDYWKRHVAEAARTCFQVSIDAYETPSKEDDSEPQLTWDLLFMIGKCHEKIAGTYKREAFPSPDQTFLRHYERHMKQALDCYAKSLEEATLVENDGGFADTQGGGSSHGATEILYRLHASRLKCLLWAVRQGEGERDRAEKEALRLTTSHWYRAEDNGDDTSSGLDVRVRVWSVLADVVSGLVQCRLQQPFFHRSVYRHAQALMWAPVLYDPVSGSVDGSQGTVPATRSHLIRGLNSSTPCASSAQVVMASIFEKKRVQLCAVWVTNTANPSSFEVLNGSVRKYDSLRGKYLAAYIDALRLCNGTPKLETLLQWSVSAKRDLPSYFYASAQAKGEPPQTSHMRDPLIPKGRFAYTSMTWIGPLKRRVNSALADIILRQSIATGTTNANTFKMAYSCFLRLNYTVEELERTRAWKFRRRENLPEVDALCQTYLSRQDHKKETKTDTGSSDWSGGDASKIAILKAALEKGKELYPALTARNPNLLYHKAKPRTTRKKAPSPDKTAGTAPTELASSAGSKEDTAKDEDNRKRKEPASTATADSTTKSYVTAVPEGLSVGDKFTVSVREGNVMKKIKITVPDGSPSKIRFSL